MLFEFANILVTLFLSIFFVFLLLFTSKILRPVDPNSVKLSTYECGEQPIGEAWARFNFRYYILALLFVIFDVEIAFIYPCAVVFGKWVKNGVGLVALFELFFFMFVLLLALFYAWKKGDLEWFKKITADREGINNGSNSTQ